MASKSLIPLLVGMMLLTGVCNTLLTKYQDMQCVRNCSSPDLAKRKTFEQPVWQTAQMFVGEMGCFLVVGLSAIFTHFRPGSTRSPDYQQVATEEHESVADGRREDEDEESLQPGVEPVAKPVTPNKPPTRPLQGVRILLLALPAICDLTGTTLMNVGLLFVAASIYQMTRGALVLFVGLFSVIFLRRYLGLVKWASLFIVVLGVSIVGLAGIVEQRGPHIPGNGDSDAGAHPDMDLSSERIDLVSRTASLVGNTPTPAVLTFVGIMLIFCAQIFTASQFVLEEAILQRFSIAPLVVVGWEGVFGLSGTIIGQIVMHFAYGRTARGQGGYFDATQGWAEMRDHPVILWTSLLIMISIGGFNYFGLSVTRTVSATSRSTIDTCRTLFIWIVSLGLGWENFKFLQVVGFALLVYGTFLFNELVRPPRWRLWRSRVEGELLRERPIAHN